MRFSAGVKTGAGSTILPIISLFSSAANQVNVTEIGIFNTTTTAFDIKLFRTVNGPGTVGSGLTEAALDNPLAVNQAMAFTTHTAGTLNITDLGYRASIGAAIGAGVIFTFPGEGIEIPAASGTVNGIGAIVENGSGQIAQAYVVWFE